MDEHLTIGEVAEATGVTTSTLRYYESIGILPAPQRINGRRRYHPQVLQLLAIIQLAKDVNFSLEEIQELISGFSESTPPSERWRILAERKLTEVNATIAQAQDMKQLLEEALASDMLHIELDESILSSHQD